MTITNDKRVFTDEKVDPYAHKMEEVEKTPITYDIHIVRWVNPDGKSNVMTGYRVMRAEAQCLGKKGNITSDDWNGNLMAAFYDTLQIALDCCWDNIKKDFDKFGPDKVRVKINLHEQDNKNDIKSLNMVLGVIKKFTDDPGASEDDVKAIARLVVQHVDMNVGQCRKRDFAKSLALKMLSTTNLNIAVVEVNKATYERGYAQMLFLVKSEYEEFFGVKCYEKEKVKPAKD